MLDGLEARALKRKARERVLRESDVETHLRDVVKARRGLALKFTSPGRVGVPDRIVLHPVPIEHQEIVAKYFRFVELKRPGKKAEPEQLLEHNRMRALGFRVHVIDTIEGVEHAFPKA
jgi:hypothetical protein